jgi:hypothetical protein
VSEKVIQQAKKEDRTLYVMRRQGREEAKKQIRRSNAPAREKYLQIKKVNSNVTTNASGNRFIPMLFSVKTVDLIDTLIALGYYNDRGAFIREHVLKGLREWGDVIKIIEEEVKHV